MSWYESVVRINYGDWEGSGVLIQDDLILTAAHVVQPDKSSPLSIADLTITFPWRGNHKCNVLAGSVHPRWTQSRLLSCDMAYLRVEQVPGLGIIPWRDFWSTGNIVEVGLYGYPAGGLVGDYQHGSLRQTTDLSNPDRNILVGNGLRIAAGMSGGPFLYQHENGVIYVVGLATWDTNSPRDDVFNGIPLNVAWE